MVRRSLSAFVGMEFGELNAAPQKLNTHCSTLQKDIKHYYKAKIISKQINHGIFALCYVGYWFVTKGVSIGLHKF